MKPIKVLFDRVGNTLNVWFDDPQKEYVSEETTEEVVLVKDKDETSSASSALNYLSADEFRDVTVLPVESAISTQASTTRKARGVFARA